MDGLLNLEYLDISNTKFTNLDVSNNDKLKSLKYDNTPLISLNLGNNSHLQDSTGIVQAQRLEVTGGSFHLAQYFPTLDLTKIVECNKRNFNRWCCIQLFTRTTSYIFL